MKPYTLIGASLSILLLAACTAADNEIIQTEDQPGTLVAETGTDLPTVSDVTDSIENSESDMIEMEDGVGYAIGTVRSLGPDGDFLTIQHGAFEGGIQMGAMTMGFDIMTDVDVSSVSEGDEIAFLVKRGRDGSYRITAYCDIAANGTNCLDDMVQQQLN